MARKPGDSRPDDAPDKLAMPDEASVLDYINSCAVPPSLRDITRAFKIGQDQRASMRRMLRDMAERLLEASNRGLWEGAADQQIQLLKGLISSSEAQIERGGLSTCSDPEPSA